MMKYNELKINWGGKEFLFVTRDGANPFTRQEALEHLNKRSRGMEVEILIGKIEASEGVTTIAPTPEPIALNWQISENKTSRRIFLQDLRSGLDFCVQKYNVDADRIIKEAKRIAPHLNVTEAVRAKKSII